MAAKTKRAKGNVDSRPDRVLFPADGFTKRDAIEYYMAIASVLLPHLNNRPVSLKRYPDTVHGESFWEKDAPSFTPGWVRTVAVKRRSGKSEIRYIVIDDAMTLAWAVDTGTIELHPFLHRAPHLERPTEIVFDLDPGEGATLLHCAAVAILLRDHLADSDLESFAKVSGSKGIQVAVPLNTPGVTHEQTEVFARAAADAMARLAPQLVVSRMPKRFRAKKVFIDWSQNADYKTTVAVYSLRAKGTIPLVSVPVTWKELESAIRRGDDGPLRFDPAKALRRVEKSGDLFAGVLTTKQKLPKAFLESFARLRKAKDVPREETEEEKEHVVGGIRLPRKGTQGGRRLFVLTKGESGNELWLESGGKFRRFILRPDRTSDAKLIAMPAGEFPADDAYFRGEVQKEYRGRVAIEDVGAWEIIEGSWERQRLTVYFTGRTLRGEWVLEKTTGEKHKSWGLRPAS